MMIMHLIGRMLGTSGSDGSRNEDGIGISARPRPEENTTSVTAIVEPAEALGDELQRARRYEHAFSIVLVSAHPSATEEEPHPREARADVAGHPEGRSREAITHLAAVGLREVLRGTDIVCYEELDGRFVLGLTESERAMAFRAMARVRDLFRRRLQIDMVVGVAQFPADGLTLEDLVETARAQVDAAETEEVARSDGRPAPHAEDEIGPWKDRRAPGGALRPQRSPRHAPAVPVNSQLARRGEG